MSDTVDCVVVGAGMVCLAVPRELAHTSALATAACLASLAS